MRDWAFKGAREGTFRLDPQRSQIGRTLLETSGFHHHSLEESFLEGLFQLGARGNPLLERILPSAGSRDEASWIYSIQAYSEGFWALS